MSEELNENGQNLNQEKNEKKTKKTESKQKSERRSEDRRKPKSSKKPKLKKKRIIVPIIAAILLLTLGVKSLVEALYYQSTDDAYIEGHLITIAPKVSGQVLKLYIDDNQEVKKGQLLLEIDPKDFVANLHHAEAKLAEAKASMNIADKTIAQNQTVIDQSVQDLKSSKSKLQFAKQDYDRYSQMYKIGVSSRQEYDQSSTSLDVSQSLNKSTDGKVKEAQMALKVAQAKKEATQAEIAKEMAEVEQAKLNLSYTKIYAPQGGSIASRSVEKGNYIQTGQALMAIVPDKMWIVANFKETQLTHIKKGQNVDINIDTYPGKEFKGRVDSIQRATGAKSSLFPPENAVGSYVKIVQRIPVKIVLVGNYANYNIVPGMSVVPKVKIK